MNDKLPELPEGYFWRIMGYSTPWVEIRKKRLLGSSLVSDIRVKQISDWTWEKCTYWSASHLFKEFREFREAQAFMAKARGNYPPKSSKDW